MSRADRIESAAMSGLTPQQLNVLRQLSTGMGFDALDPNDFHASGALWFRNRDRVIGALGRKRLIDGEQLTDAGRAALSAATGETE